MRRRDDLRRRAAAALLAAAVVFTFAFVSIPARPARAQRATDRVLQDVEAEPSSSGWTLRLNFSIPFRYVRHSPRGRTVLGLVELEPVGITRADETTPTRREALQPFGESDGPPVVEISTEAAASGRRVVEIRFSRSTLFEVSQGPDLRVLVVRLPSGGETEAAREAATLLEQGAQAMRAGDPGRAIAI